MRCLLQFDVYGTCTSIGESIGEHFRQRIRNYVEYRYQQINDEFSDLGINFARSEYYDFSSQLIQCAKENAIEEFQELAGVSRAANLPIEDVLFAVGYTDIFDILLSSKGILTPSLFDVNAECTTFIFNRNGHLFCGQNWDMDEGSANNCCYFRKHYSNGSFIQGLSTVIGLIHIGVNENGIFMGTANLCSSYNSSNGLIFPMTIQHVLRTDLNSESLKWLKTTKKAGGHYFYITQGNRYAFAVECDAVECVVRGISDCYAHTNHYREDTFLSNGIIYSSNSLRRCYYVEKELSHQAINVDSIKKILSNHSHGVCRHADSSSYSRTCASIIFDASNCEIYLCDSNPCTGNWSVKQI